MLSLPGPRYVFWFGKNFLILVKLLLDVIKSICCSVNALILPIFGPIQAMTSLLSLKQTS